MTESTAPASSSSLSDTSPMPSIGAARMADGTQLRTLHWEAAGEPWGVVEIVHGLGEHGGRYQTVADALTAAGLDGLVVRPSRERRLGRAAWLGRRLADPP